MCVHIHIYIKKEPTIVLEAQTPNVKNIPIKNFFPFKLAVMAAFIRRKAEDYNEDENKKE